MRRFSILPLIMVLIPLVLRCDDPITVPVTVDHGKTIVTAAVGGVNIPGIILDTGFPYDGILIYDPDVRKKLDMKGASDAMIGGAGGGPDSAAYVLRPTDVSIGGLKLPGHLVTVLKGDSFRGFPSSGATGYSIFGHYAAEIDYDRGLMLLHAPGYKPDKSWTELPIYFKENKVPWLDAGLSVGGEKPVKLSAYIDFADDTSVVLIEKGKMKFELPGTAEKAVLGRGLSGDVRGSRCKVRKLILGSFELHDLEAAIAPEKSRQRQKGADAIIGCGALIRFNLIFDYENKKIYLKPNRRYGG